MSMGSWKLPRAHEWINTLDDKLGAPKSEHVLAGRALHEQQEGGSDRGDGFLIHGKVLECHPASNWWKADNTNMAEGHSFIPSKI
jgi:hypothetical protein